MWPELGNDRGQGKGRRVMAYLLQATQGDSGTPSSMLIIGALVTALLGSWAVIAKLASLAWNERMGRMEDRVAMNAELTLMLKAANEKKGGS